jgi:transcriptional regulator with XRE-family HTH domain
LSELLGLGISRERAELAVRVATLRLDREWNWTDLATAAKVNGRQISEIESGKRDPRLSTILKIARALELHSLDELLAPLPLSALLANTAIQDRSTPPAT